MWRSAAIDVRGAEDVTRDIGILVVSLTAVTSGVRVDDIRKDVGTLVVTETGGTETVDV